MAELFKNEVLKKNGGGEATGEEALQGKVVALYFSAHWCPPCRHFTPLLKTFHSQLGGELEVVFVSWDKTEADMEKYLKEAHGDWYYIPFDSPIREAMGKKYSVWGIPSLIIIKPNGDVITSDARNEVQKVEPAEALAAWKEGKAPVMPSTCGIL